MDYYSKETFDFFVTRGDAISLPFEFYDEDSGAPVNLSLFYAKFTLKDPITKQALLAIQKQHNDTVVGGLGIFYSGDTNKWAGLGLTATNQLQVVLDSADTDTLEPGVYKFDLEFSLEFDTKMQRKTVVHGTLTVQEEVTPNA